MASWQRPYSWRHAPRIEHRAVGASLSSFVALLAVGCGHAGNPAPSDEAASAEDAAPVAAATEPSSGVGDALCIPATTGSFRARLQGSIEAEIDWGEGAAHCQGGIRPQGDGVRLLYKGSVPDAGPLLIVLGIAPLRPGESAHNVPVNLTVVREGTGQFYATRGDDKCALDAVSQAPVADAPGLYRLEGRGYCTQPARAVGGDGAVLLSRFDVVAIVPSAP